jgi:hypothetical protein
MVLSAAEGYAGAVVGVTRQVVFEPFVLDAIDAWLQAGRPVGEVVALLNEQQLRRGCVPCYAVLGDPDAAFAVASAPARLRHAGTTSWPGSRPAAVRPPPAATYLAHERERTHVFATGEVTEPPRDATLDLGVAVEALTDVRSRLADGEALERVAAVMARHYGAYDEELVALLGRVRTAREAVADLVTVSLGMFVGDTSYVTTWHPRLDVRAVRALVRSWSDAVAELAAEWFIHEEVRGHYVADHFIPSLFAMRTPGTAYVLPRACPACGGRLVGTDFDGTLLGLSGRTQEMCAACGPTAIHGPALGADLTVTGDARPGGRMEFAVAVRHPRIAHGSDVVAVLQVKPRSTVNPPVTERRVLPPGATGVTFDLALPANAACDLWSARAAVVSDGAVAFARRTFTPLAVE